MMNQDQYHASLLNKGKVGLGWDGVTKASQPKALPFEPPNTTDPEQSILKVYDDDSKTIELCFNNINLTDDQFDRLDWKPIGTMKLMHKLTLDFYLTGCSKRWRSTRAWKSLVLATRASQIAQLKNWPSLLKRMPHYALSSIDSIRKHKNLANLSLTNSLFSFLFVS